MPQLLPLYPSIPSYRIGTVIDGAQYTLDVRWNEREEAWYMDLLTARAEPIKQSMKLALGVLLGNRHLDERSPVGKFIAVDLSGEAREATFDDLGERVAVYFYAEDEL